MATEVCPECGFGYDSTPAPEVSGAIRDAVAEMASRLGPDAGRRIEADTWSVLEYGCHVRDLLLVQRERVILARWSDRPRLAPMARDLRVDFDGYAEQQPADVARQLGDASHLFTNVLDRLDDSAWGRTLVYNFPEPRERDLRWLAVHTLHEVRHHLLDVQRQL
jgi:DinB superfamily